MKIINSRAVRMSNYEVMFHLRQVGGKNRNNNRLGQLATITYETLQYLDTTACKESNFETIKECVNALKGFNISIDEKLAIVNTPPTSPLEIQLLVEESEEKLTEEHEQEILAITKKYFPHVYTENQEESSNT